MESCTLPARRSARISPTFRPTQNLPIKREIKSSESWSGDQAVDENVNFPRVIGWQPTVPVELMSITRLSSYFRESPLHTGGCNDRRTLHNGIIERMRRLHRRRSMTRVVHMAFGVCTPSKRPGV